jgi:predicted ATP-grasp superfamily ATP-dependent carboligase
MKVTAERWLRKPLRSCGGHGVEMLQNIPAEARPIHPAAECIYQQYVPGVGFSAVFLAAGGAAVLIGATRQLVGEFWTGAHRFAYCGSLWPARLDRNTLATLSRLGECLAADFSLKGLFGVDFVLCGSRVFVVEVNPRYAASIEVLERASATAHSVIQQHVDACREGVLPAPVTTEAGTSCGKAIVFANTPVRIGERFEQLVVSTNHDRPWPPLADIPLADAVIQTGQPILTLRAEAPTPQAVHDRLRQLAQQIRAALDAG